MSLLASAVAELRRWRPPGTEQAALREHYLDHLAAHPDGWARECPGAHLTASSLIVDDGGHRVLLTLHRRLGRWLQTGGHLEQDDPTLPAAALREATEESGIADLRLDPVPLLLSRHEVPCGPVRPTFHLDVQYLVRAAADAAPRVSAESTDLRWFDPADLPPVDDSVLALVAAARARIAA